MAGSIPLVRASAVSPAELWLLREGLPAHQWLMEAGLPPSPSRLPDRLVSFHALFQFLATMSERIGADFPSRIAAPDFIETLGVPARAIRAAHSPRDAIDLIARTIHRHASHVFFRIEQAPGGLVIAEAIPLRGSQLMFHSAHQHIAAIILGLGHFATGAPLRATVRLTPHPVLGVSHLQAFTGVSFESRSSRGMEIFIPDAELDLPFPWVPVPLLHRPDCIVQSLCRQSLTSSIEELIGGMLDDGTLSLPLLAKAVGRSKRTLQRQLGAEGTTFLGAVDHVREQRALAQLAGSTEQLASIASTVGYASASSLTRAVRRWTHSTPRQFRNTRSKRR